MTCGSVFTYDYDGGDARHVSYMLMEKKNQTSKRSSERERHDIGQHSLYCDAGDVCKFEAGRIHHELTTDNPTPSREER